MQVVVTGASGFLGQAVLKQLQARGVHAVGVARRPVPDLHMVAHYADAPRADVLVHLAQSNDRKVVNEAGAEAERAASETLTALLAKRPARVVLASSAVLYGDTTNVAHGPDSRIVVNDSYTRIKAASEQQVLQRPGMTGVAARLVNLYGPGMARANVLSHILAQVPGVGPIEVIDDTPVRDFLWVDDAARALAKMVLGDAHGIFNVGTGIGTSIRQLVLAALKACDQVDRPIHARDRAARPSHLTVDPWHTQQAFDWTADVPLATGLKRLHSIFSTSTP